jgi:hypothetical protein
LYNLAEFAIVLFAWYIGELPYKILSGFHTDIRGLMTIEVLKGENVYKDLDEKMDSVCFGFSNLSIDLGGYKF